MNENDIERLVETFADAMDRDDEATAKRAFVALLTRALVDLHRVANAVEAIARASKPQ
jgi:hypothetical protein